MSFFGTKLFGLGGSGSGNGNGGSNSSGSSISGAETIERLCDRLQSSLLIEDRHESLKTIKSLSKKYKLEVGTQAMPVLIDVLKQNRMDTELCCLALDTLCNIMNTNKSDDDPVEQNLPADISTQFTEMFIKDNSNLVLLFDLLDEFEFQIRWSSVKLINQLVLNQTEQLQEKILQIPRGVSRLIDLLNDSREIIRNDAILILNNLTKTNANIQKIIAFESGFDRIMEIIESEGSALDGGVVVEDCFNLLLNLLETNYSNQSFFKEANYIKVLCKYFDLNGSTNSTISTGSLGNDDTNNANNWTLQKTTNLSLLLKIIRCLVAPNNQQQIINDCQKAYNHFGLLHRLCVLLTWPGVPSDLLSQGISTVGEVIRGNSANQQLFSTVMMQTNPPRPIIIILLLSMINEKQPFHLRCSILYCFQCFLYKNEEKKSEIISTLLPKETYQTQQQTQPQINTGQILCTGLFAPNDFVSNWLCAVALAHTINESNALKEQLLRVQLAVNPSNNNNNNSNQVQAVSLIQQCMNILVEASSPNSSDKNMAHTNRYQFQTTISILMLLSTWLASCPMAVNAFLSHEQNIPYLISQASATDTEDKSLIIQGVSSFLLGLSMLYNTNQIPSFTVDQLKDTIKKRIGIEQFEHKLEFISQHESYTKTLKQPKFTFKLIKPHELLFDYEFTRLFKSNETLIINLLNNKNQNIQNFGMGMSSTEQDNRSILNTNGMGSNNQNSNIIDKTVAQQIEQQNALIITQYQQLIREQDQKLKEQQQLNQLLTQTCSQLQMHIQELNIKLEQKNLNSSLIQEQQYSSEKLQYQARINELEVKCNLLEEKCSEQEDEICKLQREKGILQETINNLQTSDKNTETIELKTQNLELKKNYDQLNQEQENLLTLLQEMENKMKSYKKILRKHGEVVSSDDEDEENEDQEDHQDQFEEEYGELKKEGSTEPNHDDLIPNNIKYILDSKNTSSSDSNSNHLDNSLGADSTTSSSNNSSGLANTNNFFNNPPQAQIPVVPTGQNINLASQSQDFNLMNSVNPVTNNPNSNVNNFNYFQYFNNPGQTEQYLKNSQVNPEQNKLQSYFN